MKKCSNKNCSKKGELQPRENFARAPHNRDGRQHECRTCLRTRQLKYERERQKARNDFFYTFM